MFSVTTSKAATDVDVGTCAWQQHPMGAITALLHLDGPCGSALALGQDTGRSACACKDEVYSTI
jgi:hypothetical protein